MGSVRLVRSLRVSPSLVLRSPVSTAWLRRAPCVIGLPMTQLFTPVGFHPASPSFSAKNARGMSTAPPGKEGEKEKEKEKAKEKFKELSAEEESRLSLTERVKYLSRKYGWIALGTYTGVYLTSLSSIALALKLGVDPQAAINTLGLARWIDPSSLNAEAGILVVAFIVNKFTSPLRIVIVATITPYVARAVRALRAK